MKNSAAGAEGYTVRANGLYHVLANKLSIYALGYTVPSASGRVDPNAGVK